MDETSSEAQAALTGTIIGTLMRCKADMIDPYENLEVKQDEHGNYQPWFVIKTKSGHNLLVSVVALDPGT